MLFLELFPYSYFEMLIILNFDPQFLELNAIYLLFKVIIPKQLSYVHVLSLYLQKERQYSFFFQHNLPIKICTVNPY
jgi:hypothetical protein